MAHYRDGHGPPRLCQLINQPILDAAWYNAVVHILECAVGLMIGTELVWNKLRRSGKAIIITTLTQSLGTFLVVSLVFGIVFRFCGLPLYLLLFAALLWPPHRLRPCPSCGSSKHPARSPVP